MLDICRHITQFLIILPLLLCSLGRAKDFDPVTAAQVKSRVMAEHSDPLLKETIHQLWRKTTAQSKQSVQDAATRLSQWPSEEIATLLFYRLNGELERPKPNSQVVRSLLTAFGLVANHEWLEDLNQLSQKLESALLKTTEDRRNKTLMVYEKTTTQVSKNKRPLPSLSTTQEQSILPGHSLMLVDPLKQGSHPLFNELLEAQKNHELMQVVGLFEKQISRNIYDVVAKRLNKAPSHAGHHFGREKEVRQLAEALLLNEKGHVFLTGKAGVGKTSIAEMLMEGYLTGRELAPGGQVPLMFELPITTLASSNPDAILIALSKAQAIAEKLGRHVVIFADEAHVASNIVMNAIKPKLTELLDGEHNLVHFIWATTSREAQSSLEDKAFRRRWVEVFVREFDKEETWSAVKESFTPRWRRIHRQGPVAFHDIDQEAFEFAYRHAHLEQPHAGNPTSTKELLEAAIVHKLADRIKATETGHQTRRQDQKLTLTTDDVRAYLQFKKDLKLMPGDPAFELQFENLWTRFEQQYVGNEGFKYNLKKRLKNFFASSNKNKMEAYLLMGPPAGGKTFAAELIAEIFFDGAILRMNGAEYKDENAKNKAIGAPPGYVGFKERVSVFTQFFSDHPEGGVIKVEEADYLNQDMIQILTNMITDKEFVDSYGNTWKTDQYLFVLTTNVGQEYLVPPDSKQLMTWEGYQARRQALTDTIVHDNTEIEVVREDRLNKAFDRFIHKIVTDSNPSQDTSMVSQEAIKQKRRYHPFYILSPDKEDLYRAAEVKWAAFQKTAQEDFGVNFELEPKTLEKILDIEAYEFEKGHSYVINQLEDKLFHFLQVYLTQKGHSFQISIQDTKVEVNGIEIASQDLVIAGHHGADRYHLDQLIQRGDNPWAIDESMRERIGRLQQTIRSHFSGHDHIVRHVSETLKLKLIDWNTRAVFTLIGSTGNGKTQLAKALALALFGDEKAMFPVSGLSHVAQLNNFFRPPSGYVGGNEKTHFEAWFENQQHAGGGIILFDELLSFHGLSRSEIGERIAVINRLYDFLDEGYLDIAGQRQDARAFIPVITGNALQELFDHIEDTPEAEKLVARVLKDTSEQDIIRYFKSIGVDAPKLARFGRIFLTGPLDKENTRRIGQRILKKNLNSDILESLKKQRGGLGLPELVVDERLVDQVIERVKTVRLGMRRVNTSIKQVITQPLSSILFDFPQAQKIEARLINTDHVAWFVDGQEVELVAEQLESVAESKTQWQTKTKLESQAQVITPQLHDIEEPPRLKLSQEQVQKTAIHEVYGHWMTSVLLNGKNQTEAISLIPGPGHLGFVRPAKKDEHTASTLTSLLKQIVILEAGHRALFIKGIYAVGGGTSRHRRPGAAPSDDLGRVDALFNQILSNQLISHVVEFDSKPMQDAFKRLMRQVLKEVTDHVIQVGLERGDFEPILHRLIDQRFLGEEEMQGHVDRLREDQRLPDPDLLFLYFLERSVSQRLKDDAESLADSKILTEIMARVLKETRELRLMNESMTDKLDEWITTTNKKYQSVQVVLDKTCEDLLFKDH